jgi:hypothetical protein
LRVAHASFARIAFTPAEKRVFYFARKFPARVARVPRRRRGASARRPGGARREIIFAK